MSYHFRSKIPQVGDVVVSVVTTIDKDFSRHKCVLPQYNNIEGIICRAELNRTTAKQFKKLVAGKIICTVCTAVNFKNSVYTVDLSYTNLDKELAQLNIGYYDKIMRIIDVFAYIIVTSIEDFKEIDYKDYKSNQQIMSLLDTIISDSLHTLKIAEIDELFFKDTIKLHQIAKSWVKCLEIPDFMNKLIIAFPRPNIDLDVIIEFKSSDCFAIRKIQEFIKSVNKTITDFDPTSDVNATIVTAPQYRIIIKSKKITYDSYDVYVNILKESFNIVSIHMNTPDTRTEVSLS
jgi:translation initiation factor 2 alpha subunit (eIF-2alpha)